MQVVYLANNLIEAHLARHALEEAEIPVFIFGESLLGGTGELPLFGVLRVCVPDPFVDAASACLQALELGQASEAADTGVDMDWGMEGLDALPASR